MFLCDVAGPSKALLLILDLQFICGKFLLLRRRDGGRVCRLVRAALNTQTVLGTRLAELTVLALVQSVVDIKRTVVLSHGR